MHASRYLGKLYERDGGRCGYCGLTVDLIPPPHPRAATVDHVHPKSKGGSCALHNLLLACYRCNMHKADMARDEFLRFRKHLMLGVGKAEALRRSKEARP